MWTKGLKNPAIAAFGVVVVATASSIIVGLGSSSSGPTILGSTSYIDDRGNLHVPGEVRNDGSVSQEYVRITGTFYDSQDRVVATDFTYTLLDILQAGQTSPFALVVTDKSQVPQIAAYSLSATSQDTYEQVSSLSILSSTHYVDGVGYLHVPGEIRNDNQECQEYVKIVATFYGSDVVATDFTYTLLDIIQPGQACPFEIVLTEESRSALVSSYVLQAQSSPVDEEPYVGEDALQVSSSSSFTDGFGYYHIVGEVENKGQLTAEWVKVAATLYDSKGMVVGTDFTFADPMSIPPGGKSPFEATFSDTEYVAAVASYALAIGTQTTIDELSLPVAIMLPSCVLPLGNVLTRKRRQQIRGLGHL